MIKNYNKISLDYINLYIKINRKLRVMNEQCNNPKCCK